MNIIFNGDVSELIIDASIKVYYSDSMFGEGIHIKVKFKEERKWLKTKLDRNVVEHGRDGSLFVCDAINLVKNENRIKELGEEMIIDYFNKKTKQLQAENKFEELGKLLKELKKKKLTIQVKFK